MEHEDIGGTTSSKKQKELLYFQSEWKTIFQVLLNGT